MLGSSAKRAVEIFEPSPIRNTRPAVPMLLVVTALRFDSLSRVAVFLGLLPGQTPALRPVPGPADTLVGSDAGLIVVAGTTARVLDPRGHLVRTLGAPRGPKDAALPHSVRVSDLPSWPGLGADTDWGGIYEEDDIDDSDDPRLADETEPGAWELDHSERRVRPTLTTRGPDRGQAPVVAIGAGRAWIGTLDGLWRFDLPSGRGAHALPSRGGGISAVAVSPDGGTVAILDGRQLLRSRDAGQTFQIVASIAPSTRVLAVMSSGTVLAIDADALNMFRPNDNAAEKLGVDRVADVVACGSQAAVLADGAFYLVSAAPPHQIARMAAAPIGVTHISCAADGKTWIAWGANLWTSVEGGRPWTRRSDLPPVVIKGVAISAHAIWIATPAALVPLPILPVSLPVSPLFPPHSPNPETTAIDAPARLASASAVSPPSLMAAGPAPHVAGWWGAALPRIDLLFAAARTPTRRELRGLVLMTFALDGFSAASARDARLIAEMARRRRAAEAAGQILSPVADGPHGDAVSVEERRAWTEILEDPR